MKTYVVLLLAGGICASLFGETSPSAADFTPMKIIDAGRPMFPSRLHRQGVDYGTVRVMIKVDEQGRLVDRLLIGHTHREFADSALEAMKRWRFEPARLNGVARATTREVVFTFERKGMQVVTLDATEVIGGRMEGPPSEPNEYHASAMRDLDGIPAPTKIVQPVTPKFADKNLVGRVVIDFYIDEQGRVRMPVPAAGADEQLADAAVVAVSQWEFSPPTSRGRPVLVRASQAFNFKPADGEPKS